MPAGPGATPPCPQIIDPFVEVEVIGLPADCSKGQTRVVDDNGEGGRRAPRHRAQGHATAATLAVPPVRAGEGARAAPVPRVTVRAMPSAPQ